VQGFLVFALGAVFSLVAIALFVREVGARLAAGPVRFRLATASAAAPWAGGASRERNLHPRLRFPAPGVGRIPRGVQTAIDRSRRAVEEASAFPEVIYLTQAKR
jgi:hypothetical protein